MKQVLMIISIFAILSACSYTQKIRSGEVAFERKQYAVATNLLEIDFEKTNEIEKKARYAYLLGESYAILGIHSKAASWYNAARANGYGEQSIYKLAKSLKYLEEYEKAIAIFLELEKTTSYPLLIANEIFECNQAMEWKESEDKNPYRLEVLGFNSAKLEYAAFPYSDHQVLFSSDRSTLQGEDVYNWTGSAYSDLYMYNSLTGEIETMDLMINSPENEGAACFSEDRETIYFTRCTSREGDAFCKLYVSHLKGKNWSEPKQLDFILSGNNYGHPFLAEPGNILLFSADLTDSFGGTDLYYSIYLNGFWGEPVNLGPRINTLGDEKFPSFLLDTLYFASDGHSGMGGLDVFKCAGTVSKGWGEVKNLKAPINSGSDDFAFIIDPFHIPNDSLIFSGYLTSSRNHGNQDDIFKFYFRNKTSDIDINEKTKDEFFGNIILNLQVNQRYYPGGNPLKEIAFIDLLADADVILLQGRDSISIGSSDTKGKFISKLNPDTNYVVKVQKAGYLSASIPINTKLLAQESATSISLNAEVILDKIYANKEVIIPNIFYDFDQWNIREDAKPSLDLIIKKLQDNPDIIIILGSHTDCRGTVEYNEALSGKRAEAAVNYLIENGIDPWRLQSIGYGKSRLANDCNCDNCTEDQHQENRRTTFAIIEH